MKKNIKLYVWEKVLCDWTCGIAFALAVSLEEAKELVSDKYNEMFGCTKEDGDYEIPYFVNDEDPKIYDDSVGYTVYGGG